MSPNSNIARRPGLLFACVNIGVVGEMSWVYFQKVSEPWIIVAAGLISLMGLSGLLLFLHRRAKAAKQAQAIQVGVTGNRS